MKPELYTKVVLTLIMFLLALDARNQYVHPTTVVAALCPFAGMQFSSAGGLRSFDTRPGGLWVRDGGRRSHGKISEASGSLQRDHSACVLVSERAGFGQALGLGARRESGFAGALWGRFPTCGGLAARLCGIGGRSREAGWKPAAG